MGFGFPWPALVASVGMLVSVVAASFLRGGWCWVALVMTLSGTATLLWCWSADRKDLDSRIRSIVEPLSGDSLPAMDSHGLLLELAKRIQGLARESRFAWEVLERLPVPCMAVLDSGEVRWRNRAMASLWNNGNGKARTLDSFFADTNAGTWRELCSGQWEGGLLRLNHASGEPSLFRVLLANTEGDQSCRLCLLEDVTEAQRDSTCLADRCRDVEQVRLDIKEKVSALEALARDVGRALAELVESMQDSKDQAKQVARAMQEMTDNVRMMATQAAETAQTAEGAENQAREGAEAIQQTAEVTHKVEASYEDLQATLSQLLEEAGGIGDVVGLISDIADQTNLLALNAAIEAARAGEAGRGFAVVADEVRKLAEKTLQATTQVKSAVQAIKTCSRKAVSAMGATNQDIRTSVDLVVSVEGRFAAIAEAMVTASRGIDDIAHRAEQQCASSFEINMCAMNVTECSQEVFDEIGKASRELQQLVEQVATVRGLASGVEALS